MIHKVQFKLNQIQKQFRTKGGKGKVINRGKVLKNRVEKIKIKAAKSESESSELSSGLPSGCCWFRTPFELEHYTYTSHS